MREYKFLASIYKTVPSLGDGVVKHHQLNMADSTVLNMSI